MRPFALALILAAIHVALGVAFAWITPYREGGRLVHQSGAYAKDIGAPDERQHANYVARLAQGQAFPIFDPDPANPALYETYQSHQPPLFYLLASSVAKLTGGATLESRAEGLPIRFLNVLIGACGVLGVFCFVMWGFRNDSAALAAAAFVALLPMNLALSGAISNDPLLFALCSWTLALAAQAVRNGWNARLALSCGVLMGLAFLTKTTAVALWPAIALGVALSIKPKQTSADPPSFSPARGAGIALAVLALPLLLAFPWWIRNLQLYGDPFAASAFKAAFAGTAQAPDFIRELGLFGYLTGMNEYGLGVGWWTLRSFFGVFGYMDIFWPSWLYGALSIGLAALIVARLVRSKELDSPETRPVRLMGGTLFLAVAVLFLLFNAQYFQGQARYLFPAMAPIAATVGLGAITLFRKRPHIGVASLATLLLALDIYALAGLPAEFDRRLGPPPIARTELRPFSTR